MTPTTAHLQLLQKKLEHLKRMRKYLDFSLKQVKQLPAELQFDTLTDDMHETLAAFRVRFSEYQEHLGKTMSTVAREENLDTSTFTQVLTYMEKLGIISSALDWKLVRELRNSINHEYEEDQARLQTFFISLQDQCPTLFSWHDQLQSFCSKQYPAIS
jgi:DNA-binding transcriptional MerR regulator